MMIQMEEEKWRTNKAISSPLTKIGFVEPKLSLDGGSAMNVSRKYTINALCVITYPS